MRLVLSGEQKKILALPIKNPILIKGSAGSGKTTVAIHRAKHIAASNSDLFDSGKIVIFSYTKSLIKYIRTIMSDDKTASTLEIVTFHSWAYRFLKTYGFWKTHSVVKTSEQDRIIASSIAEVISTKGKHRILSKNTDFFKEEFSWIKGRPILSVDKYLETKRTGRGTTDRVTSDDKNVIWNVYLTYYRTMQERGLVDFDDYALKAYSQIYSNKSWIPPYSHIVIDEAQDLTAAQLYTITQLVSPETNSITIVADAAQRIYKSGFAWSDIGLNLKGGRSVSLQKNQRNTKQIALAALSLIKHDTQLSEVGDIVLPDREGSKPKLINADNMDHQIGIINLMLQKSDLSNRSFAVLHRSRRQVASITEKLHDLGHAPQNITDDNTQLILDCGLYTCTMSSAKGLEFDTVAILGLDEDIIPRSEGFSDDEDELHISTERRLLYMSMTRARSQLSLFTSGKPSRFISEIDPDTIELLS